MNLLSKTLNSAAAERLVELERRLEGSRPSGDFSGSVTGYWIELNNQGVGIVDYQGKRYKTRPVGFISTSKGTEVELTYANGVYYSKF
jgi:hypothetical protein